MYFRATAGVNAVPVLTGNAVANLMRNAWAHAIISCDHFTSDAETFTQEEAENESRGAWYLRQLMGSDHVESVWWFQILTDNLRHQLEHHLYARYAGVALYRNSAEGARVSIRLGTGDLHVNFPVGIEVSGLLPRFTRFAGKSRDCEGCHRGGGRMGRESR